MNVSSEKLRYLWRKLKVTETGDGQLKSFLEPGNLDVPSIEYAQRLFDALANIWTYDLPRELRDSQRTAFGDDCAVGIHAGGSDEVYKRLLENSADLGFDDDRKKCRELVWGQLSGIKSDRKPAFRVSSNSSGFSDSESFNTTCCMMNPDPWVYSYNYPWHIIAWMKDIHAGREPKHLVYEVDSAQDEDENTALNYRFIFKYLWMISCPDIIPVLSLRSFLNLLPFFKEVWPGVAADSDTDFDTAFGINESVKRWKMSIRDFEREWRKLSKGILSVLGIAESSLSSIRIKLSAFLFSASLTESAQKDLSVLIEKGNKAVVLYGPPGTGKTRAALHYAFGALGIDPEKVKPSPDARGRLRYPSDKGDVTLVQFHPNYTYQDFVGGIFPDVESKSIVYLKLEGVFKKLCDTAATEKDKKFYIIIDEINRADLSSVFGELMYCLEYRGFSMNIPTFGQFMIPPNVYLIGTMNNTDKSLVGFDLALRRRFAFLKIPPNMSVLENESFISSEEYQDHAKESMPSEQTKEYVDVAAEFKRRADKLNEQTNTLLHLPEEKRIGHAYFLRVKDFCMFVKRDEERLGCYVLTPFALEQLWIYHILPLLEEYLGLEFDNRQNEITTMKKDFCAEFRNV